LCAAQKVLGAEHPALEKLRCLRDIVLAEQPGAMNQVTLYYRHSREAAAIMLAHPELASWFRELVFELPDFSAGGDMIFGEAYADSVLLFMDALSQYAGPELKKALQQARELVISFIVQ
jgi:hypothetical protein